MNTKKLHYHQYAHYHHQYTDHAELRNVRDMGDISL